MSATYTDKTLALDEMTLFATHVKCVIGNGCLEMRMHPDALGRSTSTYRSRPTFDFATVVPEAATSPILSQSVHIQTGTWSCMELDTTIAVTPLRQAPNCALQRVSVASGTGREMVHRVHPPAGAFVDRYEHILLDVEGQKAPCLVIDAKTTYGRIAYVGVYLTRDAVFEGASDEDGTAICNKFALGASAQVEVLHCVVHGDYTGTFLSPDTPQASLQAKDIARQVFALCAGDATQLRVANTQRWAALWRAQLEIIPNDAANPDVKKVNEALQMCMYRVLSSSPDSTVIGVDVVPDIRPGVEFQTAAMLPMHAALMLDTFKTLKVTPKLSMSALALYVVNAWATFRATLDRVWLSDVMPFVTQATNEITTRVQISGLDEAGEVSGVGKTRGREGQPLEDDAYTTILVKNALEMAIQASYELRVFPRQEWKALNDELKMPVSGATIEATSATGTAATEPEHVVNLHPYFYRQTLGAAVNVLSTNKPLADAAVASSDVILRAAGIAVLTAYLPFVPDAAVRAGDLDALETVFVAMCSSYASEWNFLGEDQDIATISSILACMTYGFARARVTGQVSVDGIHTEKAGLNLSRSASMPRAWKAIKIKSSKLLAPENLTVNIIV